MKTFKEFIVETHQEEEQEEQPGVMSGIADTTQALLSATSLADPTQIADALNTGISLTRGLLSKKKKIKRNIIPMRLCSE